MIVINMKKPETCADCHIINGEYGICEILDRTVWGTPPKDCPIVGEIPNIHGRLIDADEVLDKVTKGIYPDSMEYTITVGIVEREIKNAPTVLEAST